jgi:YegS/Rv2252/BmrU family lipid kinase
MSEFNKLLFIINKFSGTGFRAKLEGEILSACEQHRAECTIQFTSGRGHATELAREGIGKFDAVIAVGGDGTVNETAQGLIHSGTPLGILPKGSGNGLARHLGIPMKLKTALKTLFNSKPIAMDTFYVNDHLSVNVSGIGFDGHVANRFGEDKKRGFFGYVRFVVRDYLKFTPLNATCLHDHSTEQLTKSFIIAIANSSQYGNNASIAPGASVTDHQLKLVQVKKIPLHKGLPFTYRLFTNKLRNNNAYQSKPVTNLVVKIPASAPFHIDGEPCGTASEFTIRIDPSSLMVLVPEKNLPFI